MALKSNKAQILLLLGTWIAFDTTETPTFKSE